MKLGQEIGEIKSPILEFQSPRGDFGFLKAHAATIVAKQLGVWFQSPRGDFGFLKPRPTVRDTNRRDTGFNPLAGILVF